jgi:hypothetical protein
VVDILAKQFDIEVVSREDGYVRTSWLYTWTGKRLDNYRVRITVKFSPDHKVVDIKSDAEYGGEGNWQAGTDTRLLETIKGDVMGSVGRTTR